MRQAQGPAIRQARVSDRHRHHEPMLIRPFRSAIPPDHAVSGRFMVIGLPRKPRPTPAAPHDCAARQWTCTAPQSDRDCPPDRAGCRAAGTRLGTWYITERIYRHLVPIQYQSPIFLWLLRPRTARPRRSRYESARPTSDVHWPRSRGAAAVQPLLTIAGRSSLVCWAASPLTEARPVDYRWKALSCAIRR